MAIARAQTHQRPTSHLNPVSVVGVVVGVAIFAEGIQWRAGEVKAILKPMQRFGLIGALTCLGGCALVSAQHQADAAFRHGLTAQLAGDESRAAVEYRRVLALGVENSASLNNLGVIEVHRHEYIEARHLFARAARAEPRDLVALTNYGVLSYFLADLKVAQRSLDGARRLRQRLLQQIPSEGRGDFEQERWARITEPLDQLAGKYLQRIADDEKRGHAEAMPPAELLAALSVHHASEKR
jgi:tetratricopeptide (TPR) repeat protein